MASTRKGYTVPQQYVLNQKTSSLSLNNAYFFLIKNSVTGNTVDVEIEGCGTLETLAPGDSFRFEGSSPDYPFRENAQLNIGFFAGDSIVTVTIFYVRYE
jgi:hypothetical protein